MARASGGTWIDSRSEIVPSQEAAGVCEGWGAGAGGLAAPGVGDVAVALVVAIIYWAGLIRTEFRVPQNCRGSRGRHHWAAAGSQQPMGAAPRTGLVSFPQSLQSAGSRTTAPQTILLPFPDISLPGNTLSFAWEVLSLLREWSVYQTPRIREGQEGWQEKGLPACSLHVHPTSAFKRPRFYLL